jgi:hypothetical protein
LDQFAILGSLWHFQVTWYNLEASKQLKATSEIFLGAFLSLKENFKIEF